MLTPDQAREQWPDAVSEIDRLLSDAKADGCVCDPVFMSQEEMRQPEVWDAMTPTQRSVVTGAAHPDVVFCEHDPRCPKRRMSMAEYN